MQLTPERMQSIGVRMGRVEYRQLNDAIRATGTVAVDERMESAVQVRFPGYIRRVFADATYQFVKKGEPLFTVYSPELVATQEETDETIPPRSRGQRALWIPLGPEFQGEAGFRGLAKPLAGPTSAWLAEESEIFGRSLMLCEKLPATDQFCAMLNGDWHRRPGERRSA